jgi:hypothetical protein
MTSLAALLSYLIKNFLTNSNGQIFCPENNSDNTRFANPNSAKIIVSIIILFGTGLNISAQDRSPWSGFFRPVDVNMFNVGTLKDEPTPNVWLFRPSVEISAMQLIPSEEPEKVFDVSSFQSVGTGISYQHFISDAGIPYNNYGFNLFVLFDAIPRETTALNVSVAVTLNALKFLAFGGGYNIGMKKPFILMGLTYNFN